MRYIVYGAGAVGGVIGARLQLAGLDTTLVARGAHLEAIQRDGLVLETAEGRRTVGVTAVGSARELTWYDDPVVLLTVKGQQTREALDDLSAAAPAATRIVSAQNGVANEAAIRRHFASTYGICVMQPCAHLEPGVVVQQCHPVPGILDIGRFPTGVDETAVGIATDLRTAGFASEPRADIMAWKHRKLMMNLGNGIQACFGPSAAADELLRRVLAEGEAALAASGIPVVSAAVDGARRGDLLQGRVLADAGGSSWQSVERGTGEIEADWLNGEICRLGQRHGVPTPANALVQRVANELVRGGGRPRSLDASTALQTLDHLQE